MSAKDKAKELVDTYRIMLINSDTECGEEILCTVIAKKAALIAVDEMILVLPFTDTNILLNHYAIQLQKYLDQVKQEIQLL
jgi:hypothetical protein